MACLLSSGIRDSHHHSLKSFDGMLNFKFIQMLIDGKVHWRTIELKLMQENLHFAPSRAPISFTCVRSSPFKHFSAHSSAHAKFFSRGSRTFSISNIRCSAVSSPPTVDESTSDFAEVRKLLKLLSVF